MAHELDIENKWSDRTRYRIDGVPLHFGEQMRSVLLTVEGELPPEVMEPYVAEVRERLTNLEGAAYRVSKR